MSVQGIRTAHNKAAKTVYKHLLPHEKRYIKLGERIESLSKFEDYLFSIAPRVPTGAVDWEKWEKESPEDYKAFAINNKELESKCNSRSNLYTKYNINEQVLFAKFQGGQFKLSQSF